MEVVTGTALHKSEHFMSDCRTEPVDISLSNYFFVVVQLLFMQKEKKIRAQNDVSWKFTAKVLVN